MGTASSDPAQPHRTTVNGGAAARVALEAGRTRLPVGAA
jgi:hypothetical protein